LQADFLQRFLHLVELEGLDDGLDFLHSEIFLPKPADWSPNSSRAGCVDVCR
jgi:hypothetical protein